MSDVLASLLRDLTFSEVDINGDGSIDEGDMKAFLDSRQISADAKTFMSHFGANCGDKEDLPGS
jgi:hypothetical protein